MFYIFRFSAHFVRQKIKCGCSKNKINRAETIEDYSKLANAQFYSIKNATFSYFFHFHIIHNFI